MEQKEAWICALSCLASEQEAMLRTQMEEISKRITEVRNAANHASDTGEAIGRGKGYEV
ncbi:MAG: hypothetical protein J6M44_14690 [Butyrivibrio sp.]|nr:hypothetical protein [Butyrivibrio sp.]